MSNMHWRLRLADLAIRWRFKRHAERPLDVPWARERIGRPLWMRRVITLPVQRTDVALPSHRVEVLSPPARGSARDLRPIERAVLYVHGGGFIACSPATHRPLAARIAREWSAMVVVPDYRLAPEHPFPAARNDVLATYRWMLETLGVSAEQIVFAGDSAGGGLAISAALACLEHGLPVPGAIVAFSPWTDLTCSGASLVDNIDRCAMFVPSQLHAAAQLYAGGLARDDPGLSPLHAELSSLPPLCLHVSLDELLRDDTLRLAERATAAGVSVRCRTWPSVPHVWQFLAGWLPEARDSLDDARDFVMQYVPATTLTAVPARLAQHVAQRISRRAAPHVA